jgi:hypothetical protein
MTFISRRTSGVKKCAARSGEGPNLFGAVRERASDLVYAYNVFTWTLGVTTRTDGGQLQRRRLEGSQALADNQRPAAVRGAQPSPNSTEPELNESYTTPRGRT